MRAVAAAVVVVVVGFAAPSPPPSRNRFLSGTLMLARFAGTGAPALLVLRLVVVRRLLLLGARRLTFAASLM